MITFIVPTIGRASLRSTIRSIELYPGDEVIVIGNVAGLSFRNSAIRLVPCPPGGDWGHTERNLATPMARGRYIAHIDDDDIYVPGTRALMQDAIDENPGRPVLFRMQYPNGIVLWNEPVVRCGNVGTPMFLIPNVPEKLGVWRSFVGGDCAFLEGCKWGQGEIVWRSEVTVSLGHNT